MGIYVQRHRALRSPTRRHHNSTRELLEKALCVVSVTDDCIWAKPYARAIPGANRTSQAIAGLIGINSHAVFRRLAFHLDQRKDNDGDRTGGSMCTKLPMFWSLLSWSV